MFLMSTHTYHNERYPGFLSPEYIYFMYSGINARENMFECFIFVYKPSPSGNEYVPVMIER